MTTWKHCEREVARLLGGERTGCNGESRRDVEHPRWSIEVKHRKTLPQWLHDAMEQAVIEAEHRKPMVVLHQKQMKYEDSYIVLKLKDFKEITDDNS
jgi:hypothetical protein|tara:strand:- start:68 stop:358 length:291 start_codon:yes stop_codon:yes gene_type:complete